MGSSVYFSPTIAIMCNDPAGTIITGAPGSGKSWLMISIAVNEISCGRRIIAIDPKNDLLNLNIIDPRVVTVDINHIKPGSLNPFVFLNDCDSITIKTLIEIMLGGIDDVQADSKINDLLEDFIVKARRDNEYVDMQDVIDKLFRHPEASVRHVGSALKLAANSKYGKLLFTRNRDVDPVVITPTTNVVFSLLGLDFPDAMKSAEEYTSEENFTAALIYIISKKLEESLASGERIPTTLLCDEAHILFSNQQMIKIINKFLTMGRSLNMATVLASQSVSHFPSNIAQFIANKFVFKSSKDDTYSFLSKFDTTDIDPTTQINRDNVATTIANLPTGHCFYIDSKSRSGIVHIVPQFDHKILKTSAADISSGERENGNT